MSEYQCSWFKEQRTLTIREFEGFLQTLNLDYRKELAGYSFQKKPLYKLELGSGAQRVLLWTQMHGNEPTASLALIDLLESWTQNPPLQLLEQLTICILPILNPDGAEVFERRNAMGIDMNRDVLVQQSPEMQCFFHVLEEFQPAFCFNLHDQRNIFSVGEKPQPATISFLAPSADYERSVTETRRKSMQMITRLHQLMEAHLPGHTGRYSDEFYPRALGDNLHRREIPTVLIESGAYYADPWRHKAREMNYWLIAKALEVLAEGTLEKADHQDYFRIPENQQKMRDIIIREVTLHTPDGHYLSDVSLTLSERMENGVYQQKYILDDLGDLRHLAGLKEYTGGELNLAERPLVGEYADLVYSAKNTDIRIQQGVLSKGAL